MSGPVDILLSRLQGVKRTAPGKYIAFSPARDERTPSLSIRELDDGRVLVHDFGGATVDEVLGAIGLDIQALFPPKPDVAAGHKPERRPLLPSDVFDISRREVGIVAIVAADMLRDRDISQADFDRLAQSCRTLDQIAEVAYGR